MSVFTDCPFLIATSGFTNVYFLTERHRWNYQTETHVKLKCSLCLICIPIINRIFLMVSVMMFRLLSTIFQLYRGGQFLCVEETRVPGESYRSVTSH